jgi:uncharacterized protein YjbI with pentapeptide repeats
VSFRGSKFSGELVFGGAIFRGEFLGEQVFRGASFRGSQFLGE